jgi:hypothetical protein
MTLARAFPTLIALGSGLGASPRRDPAHPSARFQTLPNTNHKALLT